MSASVFPAEESLAPDEARGFAAFWLGARLEHANSEGERRGWWMASRRAYGAGVKASIAMGADDALNPYPQFSGPWEAWGAGFNEETEL